MLCKLEKDLLVFFLIQATVVSRRSRILDIIKFCRELYGCAKCCKETTSHSNL